MREGGGGAVFKPPNPALPLVLKARRANWEQPSGLPHLLKRCLREPLGAKSWASVVVVFCFCMKQVLQIPPVTAQGECGLKGG